MKKVKTIVGVAILAALGYFGYTELWLTEETPKTEIVVDSLLVNPVKVDSVVVKDTAKVDTSKIVK